MIAINSNDRDHRSICVDPKLPSMTKWLRQKTNCARSIDEIRATKGRFLANRPIRVEPDC